MHPCGSHLVDACWTATRELSFVRRAIAEELAGGEKEMRESRWGRTVWRNWKLELYRRDRGRWVRSDREAVEAGNGDRKGSGSGGQDAKGGDGKKSAIQLARERRAAARTQQAQQAEGKKGQGRGRSAEKPHQAPHDAVAKASSGGQGWKSRNGGGAGSSSAGAAAKAAKDNPLAGSKAGSAAGEKMVDGVQINNDKEHKKEMKPKEKKRKTLFAPDPIAREQPSSGAGGRKKKIPRYF
ncbi:hypothetical protein BDZ91DRAFT_743338 [Kalaharituber pfeilii]|nr:hypothetical protein BDZ91DRAFT_743338 [Kalaharituber pfeilii]